MQMFAKPEIGKTVKCQTDWSDFMRGYACNVPRQRTHVGEVLPSEKWDDPRTFRMTNTSDNARYHPVHVVPLEKIVLLEYIDGEAVGKREYAEPQNKSWQVTTEKGDVYTVAQRGDSFTCTCKGFMFRKTCRHINAKKAELDG